MPKFAPYDLTAKGLGAPVRAVIRRATHDDLDALAALKLAVVTRSRDDWADMIDKSLEDDRLLLVADIEGEIAGFAQAHFLEQHPVNHGPAGFYLTGVTVLSNYRRAGLGRSFTVSRLDWIRKRADEAWYFANADNRTSIQLHLEFGFEEVWRAQVIHGVTFDGGEGILFRSSLDDSPRSVIGLRAYTAAGL